AERLGAGEIMVNSIDRDGTGDGYEMGALRAASLACGLPIIAAGGADTFDRLSEGLRSGFASAVATAHLFNFMGDGLRDARDSLALEGIPLAHWSFDNLVRSAPLREI
ncbi:MAG: hypothetical protein HUU37_02725, partial [Bdellovibrionales bacterium]|nr:hypothetical protein [Bdellovibrionales bacterium]